MLTPSHRGTEIKVDSHLLSTELSYVLFFLFYNRVAHHFKLFALLAIELHFFHRRHKLYRSTGANSCPYHGFFAA